MRTNTQEELLKLLIEFDEICQEHEIEYIVAGGGALGAVRNGGFLPWDDDIDILIKRSEYEKLDRLLNESVPKDRAWVTEDNTPGYYNPVARYYDLGTSLLYRTLTIPEIPKCHHLEIFIMDPFPSDPADQLRFRQMLWLYTELRNPIIVMANEGLPVEVTDKKLYDTYRRRIEEEGMEPVMAEIRSEITGYSEEDCHLWCGRWSRMAYVFEDDWVGKTMRVPFEGYMIPIGQGVYHHMRENYDSHWNIIPKEKERHIHRSIERTDVSYLKYDSEIRKICADADYVKRLSDAKTLALARFFERLERQELISGIRYAVLSEEAACLEKESWEFHPDRMKELEEELDNFMGIQFSKSYLKFHKVVPLRPDLLETILLYLIHKDRYEHACAFLQLYPEWEKYDSYQTALYELGELKLARYYEDKKKVSSLLNALSERGELEHQIEIERTALWLKTTEDGPLSMEEIAKIEAELYSPKDPENRKYIGDLYAKAGEHKKAKDYYKKMYTKSRNGVLLYDLRKRGILEELENEAEKSANPSLLRKGVRWLRKKTRRNQ